MSRLLLPSLRTSRPARGRTLPFGQIRVPSRRGEPAVLANCIGRGQVLNAISRGPLSAIGAIPAATGMSEVASERSWPVLSDSGRPRVVSQLPLHGSFGRRAGPPSVTGHTKRDRVRARRSPPAPSARTGSDRRIPRPVRSCSSSSIREESRGLDKAPAWSVRATALDRLLAVASQAIGKRLATALSAPASYPSSRQSGLCADRPRWPDCRRVAGLEIGEEEVSPRSRRLVLRSCWQGHRGAVR